MSRRDPHNCLQADRLSRSEYFTLCAVWSSSDITRPSKRACRVTQLPAPPASQPLPRPVPATPSQRPSSSGVSFAVPPSTQKDKGKQKAVIRKRSANFWHLDGSVVVQVRTTLFRLHRSRLAQQSEYFGALFREDEKYVVCACVESANLSADEKHVVDSCPVYVAKGVSVLDFERLLAALDAGVAYAIKPPPFPVLASLLRAAHALQFDNIFYFATHLLREMWPQDIARVPDEPRPYALETILVAQQCDVPEVLKSAYYDLLRKPTFGQDLAVYVHAESSKTLSALDIATDEDEDNAPRALLAASDMVRLLSAKEALAKEWFALMCAAPLPSTFPCPNAAHANDNSVRIDRQKEAQDCAKARKADGTQWTARLMQNGVFELGMRDVLLGLERLTEVDWQGVGYCVGCVGERRLAWGDMRERLWKKLDVLLGLKGEDED
ncbi:hypothetical protein C8Q80DRAFT_1114211 [Daedaleopsis nitida]|nr:hypothetical protein C8Q80DRAFT_1114211 [Daedaleopsis nitida]